MKMKYCAQTGLLLNELEFFTLPCLYKCGVCDNENIKIEVHALCERIVACLQQARMFCVLPQIIFPEKTRAC